MKTAIIVGLVLVVVITVIMTASSMRVKSQFHKRYGSNPGCVEYTTNWGGHGKMLVRDVDNAEEEVLQEVKSNWEVIKAIKGVRVEGEETMPLLKVTIVNVNQMVWYE